MAKKEDTIMKQKNVLAFMVVFAICLSLCAQAIAANTLGVSFTAKAEKSTFVKSAEVQTVTVTVDASEEITWDGIGFKVYYDSPLKLTGITNKEVTLIAGDIQTAGGSGVDGAGFQTADSENSTIQNICVLTFTIPANTPAGTYDLGIKKLEITKDYAGTTIIADAEAMTTITVEEAVGVTVSGTISGVENTDGVTVELYKGSETTAMKTVSVTGNGTYSFESIEAGTYTIKATCDGYEEYSATITVADIAISHNIAMKKEAAGLKGDVNGDGLVTAADAQEIQRYAAAQNSLITDAEIAYWLSVADINGDGLLTAADAQEIQRYAAGLESALN